MKLACALIVTVTLLIPEVKARLQKNKAAKEAKRNA